MERRKRDKQERSEAKQQQSHHHTQPIAMTIDKPSGRNGCDEITQIGCHLNLRRLRYANV